MREIVTSLPGQRLGGRFWLITLAAVCGVVLTLALGRWQLGRAAQKEALQAAMAKQAALPALDGNQLFAHLPQDAQRARAQVEPLLYRSVVLTGLWLPAHTVYLDNRQMQGRPGFFVCTPLQLEPGGAVVLVQRGWVPRNFEARTQLPPVQTPAGRVRIEGRLAPPPSRLLEFGHSAPAPGSSPIRQNLDLAAFRSETGLPLADWTVLQTGPASEGLLRDWPPVALGIEKHYGYALQWFGLSGLIALLYVWFQIVRRFLRPRTQPAA